jgi:hypothetical protein
VVRISTLGAILLDLGGYRKNVRSEQEDTETYGCFEKGLNLSLTKRFSE